ncbi:ribonuclease domain-containing protein [Streptomyces sp. NPDC088745]|uniref:ribonuclease domain-containing protein n=1 Tax=Streptomyces sp. NPDC088745 TaxID=3365884 RepID=UPI0038172454
MRNPSRLILPVAAALLSTLFVGPATAATPASAAVSAPAASAAGSICYSRLPSQAHDTLNLIKSGGPYPFAQDGTVFRNREGILPNRSTGYYHEYTVITPGSQTRGARRIVTGSAQQEDYYTADHYASFDLVNHTC